METVISSYLGGDANFDSKHGDVKKRQYFTNPRRPTDAFVYCSQPYRSAPFFG